MRQNRVGRGRRGMTGLLGAWELLEETGVYVDKVITNLWQDLGKGTQQDKRQVKIAGRVRDKMGRRREKGGRWSG